VLLRELGRLRVELSRRAAGETGPDQEEADSGLGDFGEHLLPALVDRGKVFTVDIGGYWPDVGRRRRIWLRIATCWPAGSTCSTIRTGRC